MLFYFVLSKFKGCRFLCSLALYFLSFSLLTFLLTIVDVSEAASTKITLSWNPNSESDIGGYKVYYGNSSRNYTNNLDVGNITNQTISVPDDNTTFFAVTAYDISGNESEFSDELIFIGPIVDDTSPPVADDSTLPSVIDDTTSPSVADDTTPSSVVEDTTSPPVADDSTLPSVIDDTTSPSVADDTIPSPVVDETTPSSVTDDTPPPSVVDDTTPSSVADGATSPIVGQLIINNLTVASGQDYEVIQDGLQEGAAVYIDRSFTYTSFPALVQGATYIKTANDDKRSTGTDFFTFDVNQNVRVVVAHDNRVTTKPSWLLSFEDLGLDIVTTDTVLNCFVKDFPAGTVALGGNEGDGTSMYTVIILGKGNSSSPSDITVPSIPVNIQSAAISTSQIDLSWDASTDNVGVAGYKIFRDGVEIITVTDTTYQDVELMPSTTYIYTVSAFDAVGNESMRSAESSATTLSLPNNGTIVSPSASDSEANSEGNDGSVEEDSGDSSDGSGSTNEGDSVADDGDINENSGGGDGAAVGAGGSGSGGSSASGGGSAGGGGGSSGGSSGAAGGGSSSASGGDSSGGGESANGDSNGGDGGSENANSAPVLEPLVDITVNEGDTITLNLMATDPEGDVLTFSYSGLMSSTSYITTPDDIGVHTQTVTVSDGELTDSQNFKITVFGKEVDITQPTILSVSANGDPTKVIVVFSEPVESSSTTNVSNYFINNGITVSSASLGLDLKTVTLNTSPHSVGITYSLSVINILDLASTPNMIALDTSINYIFVKQLSITNLTVNSGKSYQVMPDSLQTGAQVYIDRKSTFTEIPPSLKGATYIKTANNDRAASSNSFIKFDIDLDAVIYVAYDNSIPEKPMWMVGFIDTGVDIVTTNTTLSIYAKDFPAGEVILGANGGNRIKKSMYTIIVVGKGTNLVSDTIPPSIVSAGVSNDPTKVLVVFNEPVDDSSATNVSNYFIDNGITISDASLGLDLKTVTLTTSAHDEEIDYSLSVINVQDLANPSNVIATDTTVTYTFTPPSLSINNLSVRSGNTYEVVLNGLEKGELVYIDQEVIFTDVPSFLQGATYIKTANSDKASIGASFVAFDVDKDATIYVAHDNRIARRPLWMLPFTDTGNDIVTTDTTLSIYAQDIPAGKVKLGGNRGDSGKGMYTIIVVGKEL